MWRLILRARSAWGIAALLIAALIVPTTTAPATEPADVADEVVSLPLRELGIVIDREGKGVYMPYAELVKLWQLAREKSGEPEPKPPATFVIRSARLDGTLEGETISLTATFDVELLTEAWTLVELGLHGLAITRARDGDAPLPLNAVRGKGGASQNVAEIRGKGTHTLTIEGVVFLGEKGTRFRFTLPRAPVSLVELRVPAGRTLAIAEALLAGTEEARGTTKHAFLLGPTTVVSGTLSAAEEAPKAGGILYARTDSVVRFGHDVVVTATRIKVTVRHTPIETISVLMPADVNVASVTGEAVSGWDVTPTAEGQRVSVRLARRVLDQATFEVRTETFYDRTVTSLDVPIPVVEGATDARGFVGVTSPPTARVFVASTDGMVEANPTELVYDCVSPIPVYRFRQYPARMTLGLEWPVDRFRVFGTTLLDVQRDALRLDALLMVTPVEGTLFDLAITVPPDYEILDVVGAPAGVQTTDSFNVDWDLDEERVLHVRLPRKLAPPQALALVINARKLPRWDLEVKAQEARATEQLGGFTVVGAERQTGTIGVAADASYLIEDEAVSALEPAPIETLNAAGLAGAGLRFGYTYRRPPFSATLVISKKRPLVEAATATTVAVHGEVIDVLALTEFSVWYSTIGEILLRLPASVDPENVEITGDDVRDRHRLTDEEKRALGAAGPGHVWRITLDVRKSGTYLLSVAYQVKVAASDATSWIPLPDYGPMPDVEVDRGFVAIIANREIELEPKTADDRLRVMDKTDLPMRLFPSTPAARMLFAYQYAKPPATDEALGLVVKRHEPTDVLSAFVETAAIVVSVSHDQGAFTEAHYTVLNNDVSALRMRLPEGSRLWSALVAGREIKPRMQTDDEGVVYVIPLNATASPKEGQEVVVRYWSAMDKLKRGGGTYAIKLPIFDNMQVGRATLTIYQPDEYRFIRFGGNMNLKAEVERTPLLLRWLGAAHEGLQGPVLGRARESARRTPGSSSIELGRPGGYAPPKSAPAEAEVSGLREDAGMDLELADEEIKPELEELGEPEGTGWEVTPEGRGRKAILERLETIIPELDFKDAELREVIEFLAREVNVNIVIDPVVSQSQKSGKITINLENVALKYVLRYVLRYKNLKYLVEDYAILVVPIDYVPPEDLETEVFRLSTRGAGTRATTTTLPLPEGFGDFKGELGAGQPDNIAEWLRRAVGITWPQGSSIVYDQATGTLTITNTPTNMQLLKEIVVIWDRPPVTGAGEPLTRSWAMKGMARGILTLDVETPAEGTAIPFDRLSGGGEVVVRYASSNGMGRTQTVMIILTLLVGYWLRKLFRWSRTGLVLFLAAACTIGPGLSNYWVTPYWDMVMKGVLLLIPVFVIDYVVMRIGRRRMATAAATLLLIALVVPSAWARTPSEPAAVIEEGGKRIYVPFTQVERALLGDDVGVFVPFDEFLRLWEQAYPETVRTVAPRDYALTNAAYRGRVEGKQAVFTASLDVVVMSDRWTAVPVAFGGAAIEKATLDGAEAPLTIRDGTPTLVFEQAGRHTLEFAFTLPVTGVAEQGNVHLVMPLVEAGFFELEVPATELDFATSTADRRGTTTAQGNSTTYRVPVGGLARFDVSWRRTGLARTVGRAIFHHDGTTRLYVDEQLLLGELTSKVTLVRGQLERLEYDVPAGVTLLDVAGQGLADWKLDETESGKTLAVAFAQPVTSQAEVTIHFAVEHAGVEKPIAFPDLRVHEAQSDRGTIELNARHGLDLVLTDSSGLEPKLKPSSGRTLIETGLVYEPRAARVYPRRPFALTFEARPVPSEWIVIAHTLYTVLESRTVLETRFRLQPRSGSLFEALIEMPEGFEVVEISGAAVADWRRGEANVVAVRLKGEQTKAFNVRLVAEQRYGEMPEALKLDAPRLANVEQHNGVLAVAFDVAWDIVEPTYGEGMFALQTDKTPGWMRPAGGTPIRLAAQYWSRSAEAISLTLRQVPTRLSATLAHHLTVLSDEVSLRVLVAYSVDGKPVRELRFLAPTALRDELRVVGQGLRGPAKRTGELPGGQDMWTVTFHSPVDDIASFEVRWRGEIPADGALEVPRLAAVEAEVQTVFATVENLSTNEVLAKTTTGLTPLPVEQVPVVPPNTRLATIALAYRSVEPEWRLGLSIVAYAAEELIEAQILSATLETVVDNEGGARTRMTLLVRNRTQQFLRVTFPEKIKLWALLVGDEPAQPSREANESGDTYLFPLIKAGLAEQPFEVVAIYAHRVGGEKRRPGKRLAWSSGFGLEAPRIEGLPTNKTVWKLWLPSGYRTVAFGGNMEQIVETLSKVEELEQLTSELERLHGVAERSPGKTRQRAMENIIVLEGKLQRKYGSLQQEVEANWRRLSDTEGHVVTIDNVSRGAFVGQQRLSEEKLDVVSKRLEASKRRTRQIEGEQAQREIEAEEDFPFPPAGNIKSNDALNRWFTNADAPMKIQSKELSRAAGQQKGASRQLQYYELNDARDAIRQDERNLGVIRGNLKAGAGSNAAILLRDDEARQVQHDVAVNGRVQGGDEFGGGFADRRGGRDLDGDGIELFSKQKAYEAHEQKVTTQGFRPGLLSLEFDIPRDGRLFVFSKLNEDAKIEVRLMRAGTLHGLKTVLGLVVLAVVVWAIEKARVAERVRRLAAGRQVLATFVALTALLVLVVLIGGFGYGIMNTLLVLAAIAWAIYWFARRRIRTPATAPGKVEIEDEE